MSRGTARLLLILIIAGFFLPMAWFSVMRHLAFKAHIHDLGLIAQSLESAREGRWLQNSINPSVGMASSYLGNHFSPGLLLFLPVYALLPGPITLLVLQAFYLALAAWPAYLLARVRFGRPGSLLLSFVLMTHTALWSAGMYDFHHETLVVPLGLLAFWLVERRRTGAALVVVAGLATLKEHLPLYGAAFSLYLAVRSGQRGRGLVGALAFLAYFLLVLGVLMPAFNDGQQHSYFEKRYPHLGRSAVDAVRTILTDPGLVLAKMSTPPHLYYYVGLLAPFLFLPLLAPLPLVVGLPTLFINTQSAIPISYDLGFYHGDSLIPPLFAAFCPGIERFRAIFKRIARDLARRPVLARILLGSNALFWHAVTQSIFLPGYRNPLSPYADRADYRVTDHHRAISVVAARIPREDELTVQANLATFFVDHPRISPFPKGIEKARWILLDLTHPYENRTEYRKFWVEFALQVTIDDYCHFLEDLLSDPGWKVAHHLDGYLLLERAAHEEVPPEIPARISELCGLYRSFEGRGYGLSRHPRSRPSP